MYDAFWIDNSDPLGVLLLTGLNPSIPYNFSFFGTRTTSTTTGPDGSVPGGTGTRVSVYTATGLNSGFATLETMGNTSNTALVNAIYPTAGGEIQLQLSPPSPGLTANLAVLEITFVPEPSSLAMLAFGALALWLFRNKKV